MPRTKAIAVLPYRFAPLITRCTTWIMKTFIFRHPAAAKLSSFKLTCRIHSSRAQQDLILCQQAQAARGAEVCRGMRCTTPRTLVQCIATIILIHTEAKQSFRWNEFYHTWDLVIKSRWIEVTVRAHAMRTHNLQHVIYDGRASSAEKK